jgi:pimeloyl-ACP methyl ester carboxylesterase
MLILWGKNDPFFTVEDAKAYQRDIPNAELHLIYTGHFALEDSKHLLLSGCATFSVKVCCRMMLLQLEPIDTHSEL